MDDRSKLKLRRAATILHWVAVAVLLLWLVAGLALRWVTPEFARVYFERPLFTASSAVVDAFGDFHFSRREQLPQFLPPANPDAMLLWAKQIEVQLGQPAAVFVREGSAMTWLDAPPEFQAMVEQVPRLFRADMNKDDRGSIDTLGAFERRRSRVQVDSVGYTVWIVGPLADSLRWGVVLKLEDTWTPFFAELKQGATAPQLNSTARRVNEVVQVENLAHERTKRTGVRAFRREELIYATPGVDTTHFSHTLNLSNAVRMEYYLSDEDQGAMDFFLGRALTWRGILVPLLLLVIVHLNWRWLRRLTAV